jgi:hypothetical protein
LVKRSSSDFMNSLKSCIRRVYRLRISSTRRCMLLAIAASRAGVSGTPIHPAAAVQTHPACRTDADSSLLHFLRDLRHLRLAVKRPQPLKNSSSEIPPSGIGGTSSSRWK